MRFFYVSFILLVLGFGAVAAPPPEKVTTLTGVVTQQEESFYLLDADMKPFVTLQGVGFDSGHFANYIGQKVSVSGTLVTEKDRKILRVRSIGDIRKVE